MLRFRGYTKTFCLNPQTNTPSFRLTPSILQYQAFSGTVDHFDDNSLLSSKHAIADNDGTDSEGGNVGNEYENEELPMLDREVVDISKSRK